MSAIIVTPAIEAPVPAVPVRPTVEQIDELAEKYFAADKAFKDAKKALGEIEDAAVALVQFFGIVPAKAENSRRLDGKFTFLTVTVSNTTTVDEARVLALHEALVVNKFGQIFDNLFIERTRHEQVKDAALAILSAGMPKRLTETVQRLFSRCFSTTKKAPSLKVKRIVEKPAKKSRSKKAPAPAASSVALPDSAQKAGA
jgi:hypothetical protein